MPNLNKTTLFLRRALTGAFLFSAAAAACAQQELEVKNHIDFWGLSSLTYDQGTASDEDADTFLSSLSNGTAIFSNLSLSDAVPVEDWNNNESSVLKFGLFNGGDSGPLFSTNAAELEIQRALDWRVLFSSQDNSKEAPNALIFSAINADNPSQVIFNNAANFEAQNSSETAIPVVYIDQYSGVAFKDALNLIDYSSVKQDSFNLGSSSKLTLEGRSSIETAGTAFSLGSKAELTSAELSLVADTGFSLGNNSKVNVKGSLSVKAETIFSGNGLVSVDNASVLLEGAFSNFNGVYRQTGGSLELISDTKLRDANWSFNGVSVKAESGNLFEVSAAEYSSGTALQGTITKIGITGSSDPKPFTEIVLTDDIVSLEYLNRATNFYKGAVVTYTGELFIDDHVINHITLNNHYGLLDNSNIGLASVRLHLLDDTVLADKDIKVGSLTNNSGKLSLSHSNVVLYAGGGQEFTGALKFVGLTNHSVLTLYGMESAKRQQTFGILKSAVYVENGSVLNFVGKNQIFDNAPIINTGTTIFTAASATESISDFYQVQGEIAIESGAAFETNKNFEVYGGVLSIEGALDARHLFIQSGQAKVSGEVRAELLTLGSESRDPSSSFQIAGNADVSIAQASLQNAFIEIAGDPTRKQNASLYLKNWEGEGNRIAVREGGLLILGDDLAGDGLGYTKSESLGILSQFTDEQKAVLVVNETQVLGGKNSITVGNLPERVSESVLTFGGQSALLLRGRMGAPAFSAESPNALSFQEGSSILVVDPFGTNQLTDTTIEDFSGRDKVQLVSLNKNIQLSLAHVQGEGWFIQREQILNQNFVYPELQGWLYDHSEGFTVDSENAAQKFFARADNEAFMNTRQSQDLIVESTQLASLLGTRTNFYLFGQESIRSKNKEIADAFSSSAGPKVYGSVTGRFFISKDLGGYLGSAAYRASTEDIRVGVAGCTGGWAWATEFSAGIVSSKSRHTVIDAKGSQYLFELSGTGAKRWGKTKLQANVGIGYAANHLKADLPKSMEMGSLKGRINDQYVTAGVETSYDITSNLSVALSPQLWIFPKVSEKTRIASQNAFELKTKNQTFVDIPVTLKGSWSVGSLKGAAFELRTELGASVKAGQLDKKGTLRAVGTGAKEEITQKEFRRWSGFGSAELKVRKNRLEGVVSVFAGTGDGKLQGALGAKVNWRF